MNVTRKLITGVDAAGDLAMFIVEGNPEVGYELFRCQLVHVSHHKRSWQAIAEAQGEPS